MKPWPPAIPVNIAAAKNTAAFVTTDLIRLQGPIPSGDTMTQPSPLSMRKQILRQVPLQFPPNALGYGMFPYIAPVPNLKWQPGPYPGVELMVLHKNDQTGGVTVLRKFLRGVTVPA